MRQKIAEWILAAILGAGILGGTAAGVWYRMFYMPYCVRADVRGREMDVEAMRRIEEREKNGSKGILKMAGWRIENQRVIFAVGIGRRQMAQIICVYGSMDLVEPADILSGRYGMAAEEGYCVLSESLARQLFGGVDVAGQWIEADQKKMTVAGVIETEGDILMMPAEEGEIQQIAVEVRGRMGGREKVDEMLGR